jgi:hypothetical protein
MPGFITPLEVIAVLNAAKVRLVLVGLHGLAEWMQETRGTEDVDVLVFARQHKKAVQALLRAFPHLEEYDLPVVTRLRDRASKRVAIDVMRPIQQPHSQALKQNRTVTVGGQTYKIPSLEMALVMKFAPMVSLYRADEDKFSGCTRLHPDREEQPGHRSRQTGRPGRTHLLGDRKRDRGHGPAGPGGRETHLVGMRPGSRHILDLSGQRRSSPLLSGSALSRRNRG